jgi:preprotein translocase subunit SecD
MGFPVSPFKRIGKTVTWPLRALVRLLVFLLKYPLRQVKKRTLNFWVLMTVLSVFGLMFFMLWPFSMTEISTSQRDGREAKVQGMTLGLDLKGGTHLVYQGNLEEAKYAGAMDTAIDIIKDRIDRYGVTEPIVQQQGDDRMLVQLPSVDDINTAKELIGQIAELDFRELREGGALDVFYYEGVAPFYVDPGNGTHEWVEAEAVDPSTGNMTVLTGEYLKPNAAQGFSGDVTGSVQGYFIEIEFNSDGAAMFEDITYESWHEPLGIFLDDELVSAPVVLEATTTRQGIAGGEAVITGSFTKDEASALAAQLNAGALPVPLGRWVGDEFQVGEPMYEDTVSATLGDQFVEWGVTAFLVAMGLVILFVILYYRLPGVLAGLALIIYAVIVLGVFKWFPVTLTLAGIGGFVLSIGMAVDANVLIFERMREELRGGRTLKASINVGFDRAWVAILHSNVSTLLICLVLYYFGSTVVESTQVQGFAITLGIGVALSMLSAIVVTRTLLRFCTGARMSRRISWFGPQPKSLRA